MKYKHDSNFQAAGNNYLFFLSNREEMLITYLGDVRNVDLE
jgi:hypothetical protein